MIKLFIMNLSYKLTNILFRIQNTNFVEKTQQDGNKDLVLYRIHKIHVTSYMTLRDAYSSCHP